MPSEQELIGLLKCEYWAFRVVAAKRLGDAKSKEAVEELINVLDDETDKVKQAAVEALGMIGDSRAVEPLIERLGDRDFDGDIVWSLRKIAQKTGVRIIIEAMQKYISTKAGKKARENVIEAIGTIMKELRAGKHRIKGTLSKGKPKPPVNKKQGLIRTKKTAH